MAINIEKFIDEAKENNIWSIDELYTMIKSGDINLDNAVLLARLLWLEEIPHDPKDILYKSEPELASIYDEEYTLKTDSVETEEFNTKNGDNTFTIIDDDGKEIICEILFTYHYDGNGKDYIAYTDNTLDKDGNTKVYASIYAPDEPNPILEPIETDEEWELIENILEEIADD